VNARKRDRALGYLRRSTGRQEVSLITQLHWAIGKAAELELDFDASLPDLDAMVSSGGFSHKGLRLDDGITGADLRRPGFLALIHDALVDTQISHVLIYRRDRFARPEDAIEMVTIEKKLRLAGITIVFTDVVAGPLARGQADLAADITMLFGYYETGEFLRKHAERVLSAQRRLAEGGYRTGGNAPYGFGRVLVDAAGNVLQELPPGRTARQPGCHVRIVPRDRAKLGVWLFILELREKGWGYKRIARELNTLGIPSPGAGTIRTDQGVRHRVSGKWCANTVKDLCANRAILGLQDYGRRSEGSHRRLGASGPRLLAETDRVDETRTRVIMNTPDVQVTAEIGSDALFDRRRWEAIQEKTRERGASQRGVPRARDPARYPLSCRLVDLTDGCGSILYGLTSGGRALYKCGRYMRTEGQECESNSVDAEAMLAFTLQTLRQLVDRYGHRDRLRALLEERACRERAEAPRRTEDRSAVLESQVAELREQLETAGRRMATERNDVLYDAIAAEYNRLHQELKTAEIASERLRHESESRMHKPIEDEVGAALSLLDNLERITTDPSARAQVNPLVVSLGLRIGLTFGSALKGKRRAVRRLLGGVMAFGGTPLPVPLHGASHVASKDGMKLDAPSTIRKEGEDDMVGLVSPGHLAFGLARDMTTDCGAALGLAQGAAQGAATSAQPPLQLESRRREGNSITKVNRGDTRWTFPSDLPASPLLWLSLPQPVRFTEDMFFVVGKA
jgi:hypothetical protein